MIQFFTGLINNKTGQIFYERNLRVNEIDDFIENLHLILRKRLEVHESHIKNKMSLGQKIFILLIISIISILYYYNTVFETPIFHKKGIGKEGRLLLIIFTISFPIIQFFLGVIFLNIIHKFSITRKWILYSLLLVDACLIFLIYGTNYLSMLFTLLAVIAIKTLVIKLFFIEN